MKITNFDDISPIPAYYSMMKAAIQDVALINAYSQFNFGYFDFLLVENSTKNEIKEVIIEQILNIINQFKFMAIHINNFTDNEKNFRNQRNHNINKSSSCFNAIICLEKNCLILKSLEKENIIKLLNEITIPCINVSNNDDYSIKSINDNYAFEEVINFCANFQREIRMNEFVKLTIYSISAFLIRRYFYPSAFFDDRSFFTFNKNHTSTKFFNQDNSNIYSSANQEGINEKKCQINLFLESDFIKLRTLYSNESSSFTLVLHIQSLYLFVLKKVCVLRKNEIIFNQKYSHNNLIKFYGFVKNRGEINGFVYEFMSQGSLSKYISSNKEKIDQKCIYQYLYGVARGIKYLHCNSFIHRDLKPSNILIDHDFNPYISDFETICKVNQKDSKRYDDCGHEICDVEDIDLDDGDEFKDSFSYIYSSPEQIQGNKLSFATDIYSFGLIVYFLSQKENPFDSDSLFSIIKKKANGDCPKITCENKSLQKLYQQCVKMAPSERPTIEDICNELSQLLN